MAYKCRMCGSNEVDNPGDVCELCALGIDPYAAGFGAPQQNTDTGIPQSAASGYTPNPGKGRRILINGGAEIANTDPYGNDMTPPTTPSGVQVYGVGQVPASVAQPVTYSVPAPAPGKLPATTGITKNISQDTQERPFLEKWFRALFGGIPFTLDNTITMFQVFPDYTGTSTNAMGNACDQVIVYGRLNSGAVSENNDVEVYGRRDIHNNIIAKTIKNKASGTVIKPERILSVGLVWFLTLLVAALVTAVVAALGVEGLIWAAVIILCLTNLPFIFKAIGVIIALIFAFGRSSK